jgi:7-keto-8-aminopelargonate synthetase-like enzyme
VTFTPEQDQYLQLAQTKAYYQGLREGIERYAHWRDGVQYVGTTGRRLDVALAEVHQEQEDVLKRFSALEKI